MNRPVSSGIAALLTAVAVTGCGGAEGEAAEPDPAPLAIEPGPQETTTAPPPTGEEEVLALRVGDREIPIVTVLLRQEPDTDQQLYFLSEEATCVDVRDAPVELDEIAVAVTGMDGELRPEVPQHMPEGTWVYRDGGEAKTADNVQGRVTVTDTQDGAVLQEVPREERIEGVVQFETTNEAGERVELRGPFTATVCDVTLTGA